jgi:hypothetical protein
MLAMLNSKQIVDEIVKDTVKDNDPHDAVQISPDIVLASRPISAAPALAPDVTSRPEPKFAPGPRSNPEPKFSPVVEPQPAAPSVDTAVRVTAGDGRGRRKRSSVGKWLRGAFLTFLFAGGSAAATIAWEKHGDVARQMFADWKPVLASLMPSSLTPSTSQQTAPVAAAQAAPPAAEAAADQTADPSPTPAAAQSAAVPAATPPEAVQSVQSMTRDLTAMAQQIEQLKANIAELKAGQEQMAREMAKPSAPKPMAETRPIDPRLDPRARVSALPPRPQAPPVRKPKPAVSQTYMPAYSPAPVASPPPPSQAAAVPPQVAPVTTTQAVADDDGPVVRPPMPLR